MYSRGSLETHTRFQTIMVKIYTRFKTKNASKTIPFGAAHTYIADIGSTPPGGGGGASLGHNVIKIQKFKLYILQSCF